MVFCSCSDETIPREVHLEDKPREMASEFCDCLEKEYDVKTCFREIREDFKLTLKETHGEDRKAFIKGLLHAFVETECFDSQILNALKSIEDEE